MDKADIINLVCQPVVNTARVRETRYAVVVDRVLTYSNDLDRNNGRTIHQVSHETYHALRQIVEEQRIYEE